MQFLLWSFLHFENEFLKEAEMKILSVVVPSYNSEAFLESCVESLAAGGERMDVIIVDDGSKDNTGVIADGLAEKYPGIVRVIHQENGGHGEGINQGIRHAEGIFMKVVDSDDHLSSDLPAFLDLLEGPARNADLVLNNYVYKYTDGRPDHVKNYKKYFPEGRIFSWDEMKKSFEVDQFLMIHACTFRTEVLRRSGVVLPKHMFYEDNLYIVSVIPFTEKIFYTDRDLYLYTIGREGQSMAMEAIIRRYNHHAYIGEAAFKSCRLDDVKAKSKKLYKLVYHEIRLLLGLGSNIPRLSDAEDAEEVRIKMWENCYAYDRKYARKMRADFLWTMNIPGKPGKAVARMSYKIAHALVNFN